MTVEASNRWEAVIQCYNSEPIDTVPEAEPIVPMGTIIGVVPPLESQEEKLDVLARRAREAATFTSMLGISADDALYCYSYASAVIHTQYLEELHRYAEASFMPRHAFHIANRIKQQKNYLACDQRAFAASLGEVEGVEAMRRLHEMVRVNLEQKYAAENLELAKKHG